MKTMTIQDLLSWAFVHELPKGGGLEGLDNANSAWRMLFASSWGRMAEFAELFANVDRDRSANFVLEESDPHPDALAIGRAVAALGGEGVDIPEGWNPLADWVAAEPGAEPLVTAAMARSLEQWRAHHERRAGRGLMTLVIRCAVLGRGPDWTAQMPKIRMVQKASRPAWFVRRAIKDVFGNEKVIEVNGLNGRSGRPYPGAYRKFEFARDPMADILSRLDHQLWVGALRRLEDDLSGRLEQHRLDPWLMSMAPWMRRGRLVEVTEIADLEKSS